MTAEHERYEELVAAYALDALSDADQREFEAHLASCETCRATLADLRRVSVSLGLAIDPVEPPASLRARTLSRATSAPQRLGTTGAQSLSRAKPAPAWRGSLAAAAALVCAAGLGIYAMSLRTQLESTRGMLAEALDRVDTLRRDVAEARSDSARLTNTLNVIQSGDVLRVDLRSTDPSQRASGRAYVSLARGLVFSAERLPGLAANRSYQLWVIPEGPDAAPVSVGVFAVNQSGNSFISSELPAGVTTVGVVAVTDEPAGGSVRPTTSPLLAGSPVNN